MKQLRLRMLELGAKTVLTREQMKEVTGGVFGPPTCSGGCSVGTGSLANGTWHVSNGSCSVSGTVGAGGKVLYNCDCSLAGEPVSNCSAPSGGNS